MTIPRFVSGRFCEIVGDAPISWDDAPAYFDVPTSAMADNVNVPASRYFKLPPKKTLFEGKFFHLEEEVEQP